MAAAKATQAAEEKDRLAEAKNVLRDSIISAPSKLTRKEGCALTSSIAPIGRSTNARKGSQPSQMGSLSLMAGFLENALKSILTISQAHVKAVKQSTPKTIRRARIMPSSVSSVNFP